MKIKIIGNGFPSETQVVNAETGELIEGVRRVLIDIDATKHLVNATLEFQGLYLDTEAHYRNLPYAYSGLLKAKVLLVKVYEQLHNDMRDYSHLSSPEKANTMLSDAADTLDKVMDVMAMLSDVADVLEKLQK